MGHRVLVAYDRDGYDCHYAHWGLAPEDLTPETPFGGPPDDAWAADRAADLLDAQGGRLSESHDRAVDPDPIATGLTFAEVCDRIDPLEHEALFVVDPEFEVRTYLVFPVETGEGRPAGALVGYEGQQDAAYLRGWLAGARAVRDTSGLDGPAVVRALRWLDADRGTVVWLVEDAASTATAGEREA
ncbi:DUF6735 family protein [Natronomonas sp.]|uniref:DUF6735 family protein n=1 Tax=Natronomonas sp. TaxID=2184060 RepID=UPI002FC3A097